VCAYFNERNTGSQRGREGKEKRRDRERKEEKEKERRRRATFLPRRMILPRGKKQRGKERA
jgi:hypothetical protein